MRIAVAAVVATGMALSAWWALRMPFFASPDEDVHFDYVASLVTAGRLLLASDKPVIEIAPVPYMLDVHPYTWHLARGADTEAMRFHPERKAPPGYGTRAYFAALDRDAPQLGEQPAENPWAIAEYPIGYYGLAALWAAVWNHVFPGVVALFFATRSFSVLLFGAGLLVWWAVLRRQGCPPWRAVGIVAVVAWLPLSSFVSSYVQPDNLGFLAVPLCLWLALRAAAGPPSAARLALAGAALALLALSKYHVFLAVAVPTVALLATAHARWPRRSWLDFALLVGGPSAIAAELQIWISSGSQASLRNLADAGRRSALLRSTGTWWLYLESAWRQMIENFLGADGHTFSTFWYSFGWVDLPLTIVSPGIQRMVILALQVGTVGVLILLAVRWHQVATAIVSLWRRGERTRAWRLLVGNPLLNSYLLYALAMGALFIYTANGFVAQGRHWYPLLPAIVWAAVQHAPRALASRRLARWAGAAVLAGLLAYAVAGSWSMLAAIEHRYYPAP